MLAFVASRQAQILGRRLLRFLDESVKQDHTASFVNVKEHASNSILAQARPHFVDAVA
jgi:hypothetical protein